ncbi:MAG: CD3324 family protein [Eubacteriales bacterium]
MSYITKGGTHISYINAEEVLPKELLAQVRNYIEGEAIYIPKAAEKRKTWGGKTGTRAEYDQRNRAIVKEYQSGQSVMSLAEKYCLCPDSIRKIIRNAGG